MNVVLEKFRKTVEEYSMLDTRSVLVGFSGGGDSAALLHILKGYTDKRGIRLLAVHINHMIRGAEADSDEEFCRLFCESFGIEFCSVREDIPKRAKSEKKGLEECARDFRYGVFEEICRKEGISKIATAHNADDNLETVLFNLARGCGVSGIGGIQPVRDKIIRPLIEVTKDQILDYCEKMGVPFIYDSTNGDTDYTRNYIRHNILPHMKHLNPRVSEGVVTTSKAARDSVEAISRSIEMGVWDINTAPEAVRVRMIGEKYAKAGGKEGALEACHYRAVSELMAKKAEGSSVSLPCRIRARISKGELVFEDDLREKPKKLEGRYPLCLGVTVIEELDAAVEIIPKDEKSKISENVYKLTMKAIICFDTIDDIVGLYVRPRQNGDRYRLGGMTKSVKKLLWEKRLSAEEKMNYPVVCDSEGIVFLPGFEIRDGEKYRKKAEGTEYTVNVYFQKIV